jgi:hypothetical protein
MSKGGDGRAYTPEALSRHLETRAGLTTAQAVQVERLTAHWLLARSESTLASRPLAAATARGIAETLRQEAARLEEPVRLERQRANARIGRAALDSRREAS